jgi:hypothetical protein
VITRPIGPNHLLNLGHRVSIAKVNGEDRYMIP